ncbi:MAG: hypothetical protein AAB790_00850 [Patescibacteria group bacterium]
MKGGILALIVLATPFVVGAQTFNSCTDTLIPVTISLTSELTATVPSASIGLYAEMQNASANAISDASLAVEVVQKDTGTIVDRFVTSERVAIFPNSSGKVGFVWKVPPGIDSGEYTLRATFVPKGGSRARSFAQGYPTASRDITIAGGVSQPAQIRSLTVNGSVYSPDTVAQVAEVGSVSAVAAASNQIQGPYKGAVTWRLYAPDATLFDKPLESRETSVELHPEQSANIPYNLPALSLNSYYLEGELSDGASTSYFDILLSREDGAFAWTRCIPHDTLPKSNPVNTKTVLSIIAAIIAVGVVWEIAKHRA